MRKFVPLLLALFACLPHPAGAKGKAAPLSPVLKHAVNAIMSGSPAPLKGELTPQMQAGLTKEAMQAVKQQVEPLGALRSVNITSTKSVQGMKVTLFTMHLANGNMNGTLAQDKSGKVAGLFVRPG